VRRREKREIEKGKKGKPIEFKRASYKPVAGKEFRLETDR
jgi:hypothetical protein